MNAGRVVAESAEVRAFRKSILERLKAFRGRIDRHFPEGLCRDRNLEMLLALYEAHLGEGAMTTKSLAQLTGLDHGAALRRLGVLERAGLIERGLDVEDRRRTTISLTETGRLSVESFVDSYGAVAPMTVVI